MATFVLKINTDNDAFEPDPSAELARILRHTAAYIENGGDHYIGVYQTIHDINGNDVGRYAVKEAWQLA